MRPVNPDSWFAGRRRNAPPTGFSLLELVVVLALAALLLGLVLPSYSNYSSDQRTLMTARTLAADLRVAQQEAVTRRAPVSVAFWPSDASCGGLSAYTISQESVVIKRTCFPSDVEWAPLPAKWLSFESNGAVAAGASLVVRSARTDRRHAVTVRAETGTITDDTR